MIKYEQTTIWKDGDTEHAEVSERLFDAQIKLDVKAGARVVYSKDRRAAVVTMPARTTVYTAHDYQSIL